MISHRERIQACLAGELCDRTPVALWRHFPVDDQSPETLAAAQIAFQRAYDFDLVKLTPASSFCLRDWGAEDEWRGNPEGTRQYTKQVVTKPEDWERLHALQPAAAHLAAQLSCLRQVRTALGADVPILQTVFSPLAQAKNLAGANRLLVHLRENPDAVMSGLEAIAHTVRHFIEAALESGADGVFYAVQHAQAALLSQAEFQRFGQSLDLPILASARGAWCNMLHVHGEAIYFEQVASYPVQVINWHDRETPPALGRAQQLFSGVLCGGLSRETLVYRSAPEVRSEKQEAIQQTGGRRLIVSTGCVVPVIAPHGNLLAAK